MVADGVKAKCGDVSIKGMVIVVEELIVHVV